MPSTASSSDRLEGPPHSDLYGRIYTLKLSSGPTSLRQQVPRAPGFPLHACALSERLSSLRVWHRFYGLPQPLGGARDDADSHRLPLSRYTGTQRIPSLSPFPCRPTSPLAGIESKDGVTPSSARRSRTSTITCIRLQHTRRGWWPRLEPYGSHEESGILGVAGPQDDRGSQRPNSV
jgi:hypothetical protein